MTPSFEQDIDLHAVRKTIKEIDSQLDILDPSNVFEAKLITDMTVYLRSLVERLEEMERFTPAMNRLTLISST